MRLDYVLAIGSDTLLEFEDSLVGELEQLDQLRELLQIKAAYVADRQVAVNSVVELLGAITSVYRRRLK